MDSSHNGHLKTFFHLVISLSVPVLQVGILSGVNSRAATSFLTLCTGTSLPNITGIKGHKAGVRLKRRMPMNHTVIPYRQLTKTCLLNCVSLDCREKLKYSDTSAHELTVIRSRTQFVTRKVRDLN